MSQRTARINIEVINLHSYEIVIGIRLDQIAESIGRIYARQDKFVISDKNVGRLFARNFRENGFKVIIVEQGERSKSLKTVEMLANKLLSMKAARNSLIVALGGGMVGDLAGFLAAVLLRGIPYIQIPTSLLAQIDSSIGGKVGVNHQLGKNLIGAYYQPRGVFIDLRTLKTLPDCEFRNGIAEVIKYGAILDRQLFSYLEKNLKKILKKDEDSLFHIVEICCGLKKSVVEKDEKENDLRRILNFGHTIGHAIELLTGFDMPHGEAVSVGMVAEARLSSSLGLLNQETVERLAGLLRQYKLPTEIPGSLNIKKIVEATMHDKKVHGGNVFYTLLERIGKARAGVELKGNEVLNILKKC